VIRTCAAFAAAGAFKPVRRGSPTLGKFDSCAAPFQQDRLHISGFFHRLGDRSVAFSGDWPSERLMLEPVEGRDV
jgi:hypothetical protein